MTHAMLRSYDEFAQAISVEENPEKLEELLDNLLGFIEEKTRPVPGPDDRRTVHSVIRLWRFVG